MPPLSPVSNPLDPNLARPTLAAQAFGVAQHLQPFHFLSYGVQPMKQLAGAHL